MSEIWEEEGQRGGGKGPEGVGKEEISVCEVQAQSIIT